MTWILTVGIRWVTVTEILRESMGFYQMMLQLLDFTLHRLRAKLQFPSFTLGMVRGELSLTVFVQCGPVEDMAMEEYQRLKKTTYLSSTQNPLVHKHMGVLHTVSPTKTSIYFQVPRGNITMNWEIL